jgi:hypothetical protein
LNERRSCIERVLAGRAADMPMATAYLPHVQKLQNTAMQQGVHKMVSFSG